MAGFPGMTDFRSEIYCEETELIILSALHSLRITPIKKKRFINIMSNRLELFEIVQIRLVRSF